MQARRKRWQGKFDSRNLHEEFRVIVLEGWSPIKGNEGHEGLKRMELSAGKEWARIGGRARWLL
jgi:hypothetical protein